MQVALFSHVMKRDAYFFVADESGHAPGGDGDPCGLYFGDTRVLSRYVVAATPGSLNVTAASFRGGDRGRVVLLADELDSLHDPPRQVVVERRSVLADGMFERLSVTNYGSERCELQLVIEIGADFRDMFEVRGMARPARGRLQAPELAPDRVRFRYRGLDDLDYMTEVRFAPAPASVAPVETVEQAEAGKDGEGRGWLQAVFVLSLEPKATRAIEVSIRAAIGTDGMDETDGVEGCDGVDGTAGTDGVAGAGTAGLARLAGTVGSTPMPPPPQARATAKTPENYEEAEAAARAAQRDWLRKAARWRTDNALVNEVLEQSLRDMHMLLSDFGHGPMPSAGVPWYAVPFGRDSLIASMQLLSVRPDVMRSTLKTLAAWQGTRRDPRLDEEPGKIMHELRSGEMARTGEIPFTPYFGAVDATALFVIAAGEYWRWTGDRSFVQELMPAVRRAVAWLDVAASADEAGYITYHRTLAGGLTNQGWKDSGDAVVHRDGSLARPPIALAEVQGYAYGARLHYAEMLEALGDHEAAAAPRRRAQMLKAAFNRDFWVDEINYYAMALDGDNAPVASVGSNPGHCLWTGMVDRERAAAVARVLMGDGMFSGYGVRTLSAAEPAYHPLSYHRGTVWPHDNSLIAMGLARCGQGPAAARIAAGLFAAASFDRDRRLPELFGGCPADLDGPVWYPVACIPQAWAAAAPFMLLQAALGLEADAPRGRVALSPSLPDGINRVTVDDLAVGSSRLRFEVARAPGKDEVDVHVEVLAGPPLAVDVLTNGSA